MNSSVSVTFVHHTSVRLIHSGVWHNLYIYTSEWYLLHEYTTIHLVLLILTFVLTMVNYTLKIENDMVCIKVHQYLLLILNILNIRVHNIFTKWIRNNKKNYRKHVAWSRSMMQVSWISDYVVWNNKDVPSISCRQHRRALLSFMKW